MVSVENLLSAWQEFSSGKRKKKDVEVFSLNLMDNIISLHEELINKTYKHGDYYAFSINDPKHRQIHKATVKDRIVHRAIYRKLYPFFDKTFISDSFSCRINKGTHKALNRFKGFNYKVSKNNTKTVFVLKCDIRKFFASISQGVLIEILKEYVPDGEIMELLQNVIKSFNKGLPLGNLTSQLFCNIYMNKFDQFVKHILKIKHYIRYADDFVIFSINRIYLEDLLAQVSIFLKGKLKLELHPSKVSIETLASGIDFLGWIHFSDHRVLRTSTRNRMLRNPKLNKNNKATINSYLGLLGYGNTGKVRWDFLKKIIV